MLKIYAPHPDHSGLIILPSPEMGNFVRSQNVVKIKRDMFSRLVATHVGKIDKSIFDFSFKLTRQKSLELLEFFNHYAASKCLIVNHLDEEHIGYMQINPMELEKTKRMLVADSVEEVNTSFQFEVSD